MGEFLLSGNDCGDIVFFFFLGLSPLSVSMQRVQIETNGHCFVKKASLQIGKG